VDRQAIARKQRRRQIEEALDDERGREAALAERLEEVVAEHEGPRIDECAFAAMQPEDIALVREALETPSLFDEDDDAAGADLLDFEEAELERDDLDEEVERLHAEIDRLRGGGLTFRSELVSGPGGRQILIADPAGNLIELFEPARRPAATATPR
jgi:hypothetical protein